MALPIALAVATILAGTCVGRLGLRTVGWCTLAVVGHAASLQLIDAGRMVHYQHYRPLGDLVTRTPIALALLALQGGIVLAALLRQAGWATALRRALGGWRLALLAGVMVLSSTTLGQDIRAYAPGTAPLCFMSGISKYWTHSARSDPRRRPGVLYTGALVGFSFDRFRSRTDRTSSMSRLSSPGWGGRSTAGCDVSG